MMRYSNNIEDFKVDMIVKYGNRMGRVDVVNKAQEYVNAVFENDVKLASSEGRWLYWRFGRGCAEPLKGLEILGMPDTYNPYRIECDVREVNRILDKEAAAAPAHKTLIDELAMAALPLCANLGHTNAVAKMAYAVASAMLEARKQHLGSDAQC